MQDSPSEGYLLDTNIASAATYEPNPRHKTVRAWLATIGDAPVFVSAVTVGEIQHGMDLARAQPENARAPIPAPMLGGYTLLPIDEQAAPVWGRFRATIFDKYRPGSRRRRAGARSLASLVDRTSDIALGIQENDLWIVSAAVANGLIFVTADNAGGMHRIVDVADYNERTIFLP